MNNVSGIYLIRYQWHLYWLENKDNNTTEAIKEELLRYYLAQTFDVEKVKRIFEELWDERKVLVDFDKKVAKLVIEKDPPFIQSMSIYFNPKHVYEDINQTDFEIL